MEGVAKSIVLAIHFISKGPITCLLATKYMMSPLGFSTFTAPYRTHGLMIILCGTILSMILALEIRGRTAFCFPRALATLLMTTSFTMVQTGYRHGVHAMAAVYTTIKCLPSVYAFKCRNPA